MYRKTAALWWLLLKFRVSMRRNSRHILPVRA